MSPKGKRPQAEVVKEEGVELKPKAKAPQEKIWIKVVNMDDRSAVIHGGVNGKKFALLPNVPYQVTKGVVEVLRNAKRVTYVVDGEIGNGNIKAVEDDKYFVQEVSEPPDRKDAKSKLIDSIKTNNDLGV